MNASASPASRIAARGRNRTIAAAVVLLAWVAGLTLLARRELYVSDTQKLAEAAQRISPGATFYAVMQEGKQIGFASNTLDTLSTGIEVTDYFVADLPVAGQMRRASARSVIHLSRALALRTFDVQADAAGTPIKVGGRADGDSAVVFAMDVPGQPSDTQRIAVRGPIFVPTLVPLAVALGETPKLGRAYALPTFDPTTMAASTMRLTIKAESLFTLVDSASFDQAKGEWVSALTDTVRAWKVEPAETGRGFTGWVDAQGKVVESTQPGGIVLKRMAYEIAFENWRIARDRVTATDAGKGANDILERTAISAGALVGRAKLTRLGARLSGVDLRGYDLAGGRQTLRGDTLTITREPDEALKPGWSLLDNDPKIKERFKAELASEPLLQANDLRILQKAVKIAGPDRDVRVLAEKINRWVFDSLKKEITFSVPNALDVLRTRKGDCNEHTQLYVALTRSLGIPTRIATGLAYVNGKFYYHAWPEVWIKDWVAVDPTFGQFPADASHLRFVIGGLGKQAELLRLIGNLKIQVVDAR